MSKEDLPNAPICMYNHTAHFGVDRKKAFRDLVLLQQKLARAKAKINHNDTKNSKWYWAAEIQYCQQKLDAFMAENNLKPKLVYSKGD